VPDATLSLQEHCIHPYRTPSTASVFHTMIDVCKKYEIPVDVPYSKLTPKQKDVV
jgi:excinuclease UvrABC ATPase subunit